MDEAAERRGSGRPEDGASGRAAPRRPAIEGAPDGGEHRGRQLSTEVTDARTRSAALRDGGQADEAEIRRELDEE
jgi:hypothetical protein